MLDDYTGLWRGGSWGKGHSFGDSKGGGYGCGVVLFHKHKHRRNTYPSGDGQGYGSYFDGSYYTSIYSIFGPKAALGSDLHEVQIRD